MTLRTLSFASAFVLAATLVAQAADITGKWTAQVPGRDGQTRETTFDLQGGRREADRHDDRHERRCADHDGTVKGDAIAFTVVDQLQGQEVKILYKGTVAGDGDQVHAPARRRRPSRPAEFVANEGDDSGVVRQRLRSRLTPESILTLRSISSTS